MPPREEFQSSTVIKKPIRETFLFVSDPLNFPLWTGVTKVEPITQEPKEKTVQVQEEQVEGEEQQGGEEVNTYKVVRSSLFSTRSFLITVTENAYPSTFGFQSEEPRGKFLYTFEEVEEDTRVTVAFTPEQKSTLLKDVVTKRNLDNLLLELKRYLEKN